MSTRILIYTTILVLTTGAAIAREPSAPAWNIIAFDMKSWGQPVASWTVFAGGGGNWIEMVQEAPQRMGDYTLVVHAIEAGDRGFAQLLEILQKLPRPAPDYQACKDRMTDAPYGTIRLTRGSTTTEIAWNAGCMDKPYVAFLGTLKEADTLVASWGKTGKILRSEKHGPP